MNDDALWQRIHDSFQQQTLMHTIGASLTRVEAGKVDISLPFRDDLCQQHGFIHAGIITTIVDSAAGYAAYTLMPPDSEVLTVEFKVNFMAPAVGDLFIARTAVKKAGRTLTVCTGDVFAQRDGQEKLIVTMQATMICVRQSAKGEGRGTTD